MINKKIYNLKWFFIFKFLYELKKPKERAFLIVFYIFVNIKK